MCLPILAERRRLADELGAASTHEEPEDLDAGVAVEAAGHPGAVGAVIVVTPDRSAVP